MSQVDFDWARVHGKDIEAVKEALVSNPTRVAAWVLRNLDRRSAFWEAIRDHHPDFFEVMGKQLSIAADHPWTVYGWYFGFKYGWSSEAFELSSSGMEIQDTSSPPIETLNFPDGMQLPLPTDPTWWVTIESETPEI